VFSFPTLLWINGEKRRDLLPSVEK